MNNLYSVPRKTAPDWVKGDKLLLLLDGLDEVRQESRAKCLDAINAFRKEHGLTSLAVCSRSQDYADLNAKLSFEGATEVQPLTQKQIAKFFNRFGKEMAGIKQVLKKDGNLREMAETPLFLSIMILAYQDKRDVDILVSQDENAQRKYLFDTYIERMFERPHSRRVSFRKRDILHWLSWLAHKMIDRNVIQYLHENMNLSWISQKKHKVFTLLFNILTLSLVFIIFWTILVTILEMIVKIRGGLESIYLIITLFLVPILFWTDGRKILSEISNLGIAFAAYIITLVNYYTLRFALSRNNLLPWRLVPFLDHCVDLIFLRRVGGGYIFVHRLLMEHFAEMYVETPTSKGN